MEYRIVVEGQILHFRQAGSDEDEVTFYPHVGAKINMHGRNALRPDEIEVKMTAVIQAMLGSRYGASQTMIGW